MEQTTPELGVEEQVTPELVGFSRKFKQFEWAPSLIAWAVVSRKLHWWDITRAARGSVPPLPGELEIVAADLSGGAKLMTSDGRVWQWTQAGWCAGGRVSELAAEARS